MSPFEHSRMHNYTKNHDKSQAQVFVFWIQRLYYLLQTSLHYDGAEVSESELR